MRIVGFWTGALTGALFVAAALAVETQTRFTPGTPSAPASAASPETPATPAAPAGGEAEAAGINVAAYKKEIAAGTLTPAALAELMADANTRGFYDNVAELAEAALGTPASVREAATAERDAAARAEARLPQKRKGRSAESRAPKFSAGVELYRADARVWNEAGVAYFMLGRLGDAKEDFDAALARDPAYDEPHVNLGLIYRKKGWYEKALAEYDAALALAPANPTSWYNRAVCLLRLGRVPEAVTALETAHKLEPKYRPPLRRLALLWYDLGDYDAAYQYADKLAYLVKADPTATADEQRKVLDLVTLCENRLAGKTPGEPAAGGTVEVPAPSTRPEKP
jgi:tetratricopeptide (TPR) repeat protein